MLCKLKRSAKTSVIMLIVGILLAAFGVLKAITLPETAHAASRLMGMFTGLGSAIAAISAVHLIQLKISSPEKLRWIRIEEKDERNIQITRIAYTIASLSATFMFAGLVFLFTAMGSIKESYICLAALLIQSIIFLISYVYYKKKM
jgi:hypothetical protein